MRPTNHEPPTTDPDRITPKVRRTGLSIASATTLHLKPQRGGPSVGVIFTVAVPFQGPLLRSLVHVGRTGPWLHTGRP